MTVETLLMVLVVADVGLLVGGAWIIGQRRYHERRIAELSEQLTQMDRSERVNREWGHR